MKQTRKSNGQFLKGSISPKRNGQYKICEVCNLKFYVNQSQLKSKPCKTCSSLCSFKSRKGISNSPKTQFKKGQFLGDKHFLWKGDKVGYFALHTWINRNFPKIDKCESCGIESKLEWANVTGNYSRNRADYQCLCICCHRRADAKNPQRPVKLDYLNNLKKYANT